MGHYCVYWFVHFSCRSINNFTLDLNSNWRYYSKFVYNILFCYYQRKSRCIIINTKQLWLSIQKSCGVYYSGLKFIILFGDISNCLWNCRKLKESVQEIWSRWTLKYCSIIGVYITLYSLLSLNKIVYCIKWSCCLSLL